jgi:hypothetical protein
MTIYISNSLYIAGIDADINENNPIIGYQSVLTPSGIIASDTVFGRSPGNMWTPDTSNVWQGEDATTSTTQYITLINQFNDPIDYIGVARHNFGTVGFTYTIQHSTDGGSTWADVAGPRVIATNNAIVDYFDSLLSGQFRIRLQKTAATIAAPIIAHVKMGEALVLQRRIHADYEPPLCDYVKKIQNVSESGQFLGQIVVRKYKKPGAIKQSNNTPEFVREKIIPFIQHCNGQVEVEDTSVSTFFWAWRPSDYPDEVVYCWSPSIEMPTNQSGKSHMTWSAEIEAVS